MIYTLIEQSWIVVYTIWVTDFSIRVYNSYFCSCHFQQELKLLHKIYYLIYYAGICPMLLGIYNAQIMPALLVGPYWVDHTANFSNIMSQYHEWYNSIYLSTVYKL